ncbi:MAG: DNA alkylation repair protein [Acidobacteria bacterium]|nr:DNA alkylation repair protein [Acidobacteriota bacterium]
MTGLAEAIERELRALGDPERAAAAKLYLKSDLVFIGVRAPQLRSVLRACLAEHGRLDRTRLLLAVNTLWSKGIFELRAAAVELLEKHARLLAPADIELVERLLRESNTWALVDGLAPCVAGPLIDRVPELEANLDRWAEDESFWLRRAALLVHLLPLRRGQGNFDRFARYADAMLSEREFFIRKAIGWILRETGKKRPELVVEFLRPRIGRASGITVREAVKYLPATDRRSLRAAAK